MRNKIITHVSAQFEGGAVAHYRFELPTEIGICTTTQRIYAPIIQVNP